MGNNSARDLFFHSVIGHADEQDVYIVAADLRGKVFDQLCENSPSRFVKVGIAEQNMVAIASGLALAGKRTYTYSIGAFLATRALDQVRNAVALMKLPVVMVVFEVGFGGGMYGATHFSTEDCSVISYCPGVEILNLSDDSVAEEFAEYSLYTKKPVYLRIDRQSGWLDPYEKGIDWGKGFRVMRNGEGVVILSYGYLMNLAVGAEFDIQPTIIDIFKRPFNEDALVKLLSSYNTIVVYEEQQIRSGIGSILERWMFEQGIKKKIILMGIDYCGEFPEECNDRSGWLKKYGISQEDLIRTVNDAYRGKNS
ncbi:MAG: hypothetical protein K2N63_15915 [Lachnospiraceae bacterium]|nr:hypothetical protein [Lachnospiraceae bacterium]